MTTQKLQTKATDNHGYEYDVEIQQRPSASARFDMAPVLKIKSTPGGWYMETLENCTDEQIAIDFGQSWYCTNIQALLEEARLNLNAR